MNISALLVFVCAVVSVYGYHALPCSDCNHPCIPEKFQSVTDQLSKHMAFSDCRLNNHILNTENPAWKCEILETDTRRVPTVFNATCEKCRDSNSKEVPILQNINMLFKQNCPTYNHSLYIVTVKQVTISLGCTCAKKNGKLGKFPFRKV